MDSPMTWNAYLSVRIAIWAAFAVLVFLVAVAAMIVQWYKDRHVNDEEKENHEPYAGKTLGL